MTLQEAIKSAGSNYFYIPGLFAYRIGEGGTTVFCYQHFGDSIDHICSFGIEENVFQFREVYSEEWHVAVSFEKKKPVKRSSFPKAKKKSL